MIIKRVVSSALLVTCAAASPAAAAPSIAAAPPIAAPDRAAFTLTSTAFPPGGTIPAVHECTSGDNDPRKRNESPPLAWSGAPAAARSYAIIMRDLDNRNLLHWVIYDVPVEVTSLPQNVEHAYRPSVPSGARQVYYRGSADLFGYQGPCSPTRVNTYEFTVYALDRATLTELDSASTTREAARVITGASLGSAALTGES